MREFRQEIIRTTLTRVKRIEVILIAAMLISRTLAQSMPALRQYARTGTTPIILTPARRTVSTVRNGSLAECLSVSAPGITGDGDTADTMADTTVTRGTTGVATTDAAITDMAMSGDEDTPADMKVTMRAAATPEADTTVVADTVVAAQFMAALDFTVAAVAVSTVAAVVASTAAVDMAGGTAKPN